MAQQSAFRINGVIDTSKNCLDNITAMCTAAGCWVSYDVSSSLWSVIINNVGTSKFSFNNSNILGNINVSGTGIDQLYNEVEVQYPLADINNTIDYANLSYDTSLWNPHETYKLLSIQTDLVNNPVQAQFIGQVQLKQNRVDKIVNFSTDYSALGLKAGDLVDLTVEMYGYTNKMFRIITIIENDDPNAGITLDITALEYDPDVYSSAGLTYTDRTTSTGITPISNNSAVTTQDANAARSLITINSFQTGAIVASSADGSQHEISLGHSMTLPYTGNYHTTYAINWGGTGNPTITIGGTTYYWGVAKFSWLVLKVGGTVINDIGLASTGDRNVPLYEDHFLDSFFSGTKGQVVDFYFRYATNWGGDYGGNGGAGTDAGFVITSETKFNGTS
jgi:hypothetical protein